MATKKKTTARARGSITARGNGKYLVRVYRGVDATGKRVYQSKLVTGTRTEAQRELTKLQRETDTATDVRPNRHTLKDYLEDWLRGRTGIVPKTLRGYRERLERDVIPYFGSVKLSKLSGPDFQILFKELVEGPEKGKAPTLVKDGRRLSPRTVQYTHSVLNQALEDAVEHRLIARNPVRRVKRPPVHRSKAATPLSPIQAGQLMEWASEHDKPHAALWTLLLTTGMRPGEALALRWSDMVVDADTGDALLSINRVLREDAEGAFFIAEASAKTRGSLKPISIPSETVQALKTHKAAQNKYALKHAHRYERNELMFANSSGHPLDMAKVRRKWKLACKRAGVPAVRLYDARHTHATVLLMSGVNPRIVQERLRHSSVNLTLNTYSHVLPETEKKTADIVSGAFFKKAAQGE